MTTRETSQNSTPNNASPAKTSDAKGASMTPPDYDIDSVDSGLVIQAMSVTPANDKYEQEANSVAQRVVQQINAPQPVQRKGEDAPNSNQRSIVNLVQRSGGDMMGGAEVSSDVESRIQAARGSGSPIAENHRAKLESAFGTDFSGVRVHTDGKADKLNQSMQARAFTTGQDIFFRQGEYQPGSKEGQSLLAHELTHVRQQRGKEATTKNISYTGNQTIQRAIYHPDRSSGILWYIKGPYGDDKENLLNPTKASRFDHNKKLVIKSKNQANTTAVRKASHSLIQARALLSDDIDGSPLLDQAELSHLLPHVDHIWPFDKGGPASNDNAVILNAKQNTSKNKNNPYDYKEYLGRYITPLSPSRKPDIMKLFFKQENTDPAFGLSLDYMPGAFQSEIKKFEGNYDSKKVLGFHNISRIKGSSTIVSLDEQEKHTYILKKLSKLQRGKGMYDMAKINKRIGRIKREYSHLSGGKQLHVETQDERESKLLAAIEEQNELPHKRGKHDEYDDESFDPNSLFV
jgi:hypothetical protein